MESNIEKHYISWSHYIACLDYRATTTSFMAVAYEYAVEMTYPLPEGTSAGLMNATSQVDNHVTKFFIFNYALHHKVWQSRKLKSLLDPIPSWVQGYSISHPGLRTTLFCTKHLLSFQNTCSSKINAGLMVTSKDRFNCSWCSLLLQILSIVLIVVVGNFATKNVSIGVWFITGVTAVGALLTCMSLMEIHIHITKSP